MDNSCHNVFLIHSLLNRLAVTYNTIKDYSKIMMFQNNTIYPYTKIFLSSAKNKVCGYNELKIITKFDCLYKINSFYR